MARTSQEIEQELDNEISNYPELNELQANGSMVSFWNYCKKVIVFLALQLEILFDKHKEEVNTIISKTETGSLDWYINLCYEYQHGDSLIVDNNRPVYSEIDLTKRIIKRVSIVEQNDASLHIKVVKEVAGELVKLDVIELSSFTAYIFRRKIAGTKITVQSLDADQLALSATIQLDPLLYNSSGQLLSDTSQEPVKNEIKNFLKTFDFGGILYLSKLTDKIMDLEGIIDFYITSTELNGASFNQKVVSPAGYIKLDNANTQLNYVFS